MRAISAIALNTFREAMRDRILYLLLAFAAIVIAASRLLSMLTVGSEDKIVKDLGLSAISLFGVLTAVFVGVSLVFKEIERRTIFTLLANPVRRWQFILGKYAGLLLVLTMNVAFMTLVLTLVLLARGVSPWGLYPAVLLILVQLTLVTAFATLFSSYTKPILSALGTIAVWVAGSLSWSLDLLKERLTSASGRFLCDALHVVVPNLDRLDIKAAAVHGLALPEGTLIWGVLYGGFYTLVVLAAACLVFERREFV
jgi:ABC-type transport system involved in multi-copper enzyme maturation permease subunit